MAAPVAAAAGGGAAGGGAASGGVAGAGVQAGGNVLTALLQARAAKKRQERDIALKLLQESIAQSSKGAGTLASGTATNLQTILAGVNRSVR